MRLIFHARLQRANLDLPPEFTSNGRIRGALALQSVVLTSWFAGRPDLSKPGFDATGLRKPHERLKDLNWTWTWRLQLLTRPLYIVLFAASFG